jgi:hypothetical protein
VDWWQKSKWCSLHSKSPNQSEAESIVQQHLLQPQTHIKSTQDPPTDQMLHTSTDTTFISEKTLGSWVCMHCAYYCQFGLHGGVHIAIIIIFPDVIQVQQHCYTSMLTSVLVIRSNRGSNPRSAAPPTNLQSFQCIIDSMRFL